MSKFRLTTWNVQNLFRPASGDIAARGLYRQKLAALAQVITVGDLNDGAASATSEILYGPTGSKIDIRGFHLADTGDAQRLWNLSGIIPAERRFSRVHAGHGEMLDHILVSEEFLPHEGAVVELGASATALQRRRLPVHLDARVEGLRSIGDDPQREQTEVLPDHAPVSAGFELRAER